MITPFQDLSSLIRAYTDGGAPRILFKALAENDNCKQQIYLGSNFDVLKLLPFGDIVTCPGGARPNFKAPIRLEWVDASGRSELARGAQLILYPDYPEVRLSGFLRGSALAPAESMRPVPAGARRHAGAPDGRILFLATRPDGAVLAYLALPGSPVANEALAQIAAGHVEHEGVFYMLGALAPSASRLVLMDALREICDDRWHSSRRMLADGTTAPYSARNGGGYTLEALLGIRPNGTAEPDFRGWEIKAHGSDRITLMTPEPDSGYYGEEGVRAFVERYGRVTKPDQKYFTGSHRVGKTCASSGQILQLSGFDAGTKKVTNVNGGIELVDANGAISARWSFGPLLQHWGRKHAFAAYVPYLAQGAPPTHYQYQRRLGLGEGTEFQLLLGALASGAVLYDPASKVYVENGRSKVKARSQFRISAKKLSDLYTRFEALEIV